MSTRPRPLAPPTARSAGRKRPLAGPGIERSAWRALAAATAAAALLQLDGTIITVALPTVSRELKVSVAASSIVLSAYFLPYALLLWPGGSLVDRLGPRRVGLWGLAIFAVGALGGALAPSFGALVGARVVQGVGAGLVSPAALAGAVAGFPAQRRGVALGIWGASAGAANLVGPLLGGLLTAYLGWRAVWWALLPLAAASAVALAACVAGRRPFQPGSERSPLANPVVRLASGVAALTFAVMIGAFFLAEQYLQRSAHFGALAASAALLLVAALVGAAAPLAGRLADRRGERLPALLGFCGAAVGLGLLAIPATPLASPLTALPLVPVGLGLGMLFVPTSRAALNATPAGQHGRTSALLSAGRLLGAAVGAGAAGAALGAQPTADHVHFALSLGAAVCLAVGLPLAARLGSQPQAALAALDQ